MVRRCTGWLRRAAVQRHEEDKGKAGGREAYLDLIHYRSIIEENWGILGDLMGMGTGSKSKKTLWIYETNEIRKIAMHASRVRACLTTSWRGCLSTATHCVGGLQDPRMRTSTTGTRKSVPARVTARLRCADLADRFCR